MIKTLIALFLAAIIMANAMTILKDWIRHDMTLWQAVATQAEFAAGLMRRLW